MENYKITMDTKFKISEMDRITGARDWDNKKSLNDLKKSGWDFSQEDLDRLVNGQISESRRIIFVHPKNYQK